MIALVTLAATSDSPLGSDPFVPSGDTRHSGDSLITVREVLALPVMRRGVPEVVAAEEALDQTIRWVHSGEVPNIAEMLKGGELLMMTGMGIGHGEHEQRCFIDALSDREIAGLAIELGTRFRRVPRALAEAAARRRLPLIALHHEIRFVEVTEAVHREIVSRQLEMMRRGDELHRRFTALMLEGAGIPDVLAELADAVGNPVILEKAGHGVLYHATNKADDATVLAAWDLLTRHLPGAPAAVEHPVPTGGQEPWGRVVALAVDGPLDERGGVAVERAVGLIALALLRDRAEEAVTSRERGNFLACLLEPDVDEAEARQRAAGMGFSRGDGLMLPIVVARSPWSALRADGGDEDSWALVWRDVQGELAGRRVPVIGGTRRHERELLIVVGIGGGEARAPMADRVAALAADAGERHLGIRDGALVCVGPAAQSWAALGAGLGAAVEGLVGAAHAHPRAWHDATVPDFDGLLWSLRDRPELRRFAEIRLQPLIEHDRRRRLKLLPTLTAYCEHGGRKAATARALHIERQSLYHRLARIEEILGTDISDSETVLALHLALRAREHVAPAP